MMEPVTSEQADLDALFDLFNEDFSDSMAEHVSGSVSGESEPAEDSQGDDETSSESSGSSGRPSSVGSDSPSFQDMRTFYPSPPSVAFAPNPLSSFAADVTLPGNKRTKTEDKLIRNRESANKSRLKRKHEKAQLEETVAALQERVRALEMENTALLTDNTTLSQHNFFLQGLLKKQQSQSDGTPTGMDSRVSALSGISVLCVVFSVSLLNDWLPCSLLGGASSGEDGWSIGGSSAGRVLLSVEDEGYGGMNAPGGGGQVSLAAPAGPQHAVLQYALLAGCLLLYFCFVRRSNDAQKTSTRILPS